MNDSKETHFNSNTNIQSSNTVNIKKEISKFQNKKNKASNSKKIMDYYTHYRMKSEVPCYQIKGIGNNCNSNKIDSKTHTSYKDKEK